MSEFKKAAVLGFPVRHSKSPMIHNFWIKQYGMQGHYDAHEVHPDLFNKDRLQELIKDGYCGFNLTLPHKERALEYCDLVDETAQKIGAVNTIHVHKGKMIGTNTDAFGFIQSIKNKVPDFDFKARPAAVLGAGGAAMAAVYGLLQEGAPEVLVFNRTLNNAEYLAKNSVDPARVKVFEWQRRNANGSGAGLIVNTTPLGMKRYEPLIMDFRQFEPNAVAYDMVYAPILNTRFLQDAKKADMQVVSGIHMLLQQARPAFKMWFGVMPDVNEELFELVTKK